MAFNDTFRLSAHAVILNSQHEILLLKANYGDYAWGLPGGALEPGETIHEALHRECLEETGLVFNGAILTGVYYHSAYNSQAFIFRCTPCEPWAITLSSEHSHYDFFDIETLTEVQRTRVHDFINYTNEVISRRF